MPRRARTNDEPCIACGIVLRPYEIEYHRCQGIMQLEKVFERVILSFMPERGAGAGPSPRPRPTVPEPIRRAAEWIAAQAGVRVDNITQFQEDFEAAMRRLRAALHPDRRPDDPNASAVFQMLEQCARVVREFYFNDQKQG